MAKINNGIPEVLDRDYTDNFSVKEMAKTKLIPKYFDGEDISDLNVGLAGYVTELISDGLEDTFNTASALHNEMYPNRAKLPSSIMSYGSIFQISNGICNPASCDFLLILNEEYIIKNFEVINGQNLFYIDKDTQILVEDIVFSLDYDIVIKAVWKEISKGYIYSAQYDISGFKNSISNITNPYIKLNKSKNGYIGISVTCHQVKRVEEYEHIINNTKINLPNFSLTYDGQLAGFDILYKGATDIDYSSQLTTLMKYSAPLKTPFCYYAISDENKLNVFFGNRNNYFQPDFNSECKVILYLTEGKKGNFDVYNGKDVAVINKSDRFSYNDNFFLIAKVMSPSSNGTDVKSLEAVQALTVEGFRTATVYATDNDLEEYFNNYKYRFDNECIFIKKRDDLADRLYSGYLIIKKEDYIYPTNTVYINTNINQMKYDEATNRYFIEPGTIFVYENTSENVNIVTKDMSSHLGDYNTYLTNNGKTKHDISFYEYLVKEKHITDSSVTIFNTEEVKTAKAGNRFVYFNPFLISANKNPSTIGMYLTIINQNSVVDFIDQNFDMFEQFLMTNVKISRLFVDDKKYKIQTAVIPSVTIPDVDKIVLKYGDKTKVNENKLRLIMIIKNTSGQELCVTELIPTHMGSSNDFHFEGSITTDNFTTNAMFRLVDGVTPMVNDWNKLVPMEAVCELVVMYKPDIPATNRYTQFIPTLVDYNWTNVYSTNTNPLSFIKPLNMIKSNLIYKDHRLPDNSMGDITISSIPVMSIDVLNNMERFEYFVKTFSDQYMNLEKAIDYLRTSTHIDLKFYNTCGKSKNFIIGDEVDGERIIDTINIKIKYTIWLKPNTDILKANEDLKIFIKDYIESINNDGTNSFYNSNLIRAMENKFSYIHHIKFNGINNYDTNYQTVKNITTDLSKLNKNDRIRYVPEILVANLENIDLAFITT